MEKWIHFFHIHMKIQQYIFSTNIEEHNRNTTFIIRAATISKNKMFKNITEQAKNVRRFQGKCKLIQDLRYNFFSHYVNCDSGCGLLGYLENLPLSRDKLDNDYVYPKGNSQRNHVALCF
jgi:hypothetical protein